MAAHAHFERVVSSRLPTRYGEFELHLYDNRLDGKEHLALVLGEIANGEPVLVRVHS